MQVNIFYSWQSDLPDSTNRIFIENCLEKAKEILSIDDTFSLELRIDMDTKGISFSPDVMSTVFAKIEASQIFVADITLINRRCAKNSKNQIRRTPNPNVLVELGYAAALLGWNNVILVYNTAYGEIEELPFDLRGRKPLTYHLNSDEDKTEKEKYLIEAFASAFQEQRELFKNHPMTKLYRFCESKFFWIRWEVEVLVLNMRKV
ncbi:MAG: TIR domain-containing protein, partial [Saprospiraceae bacterium]